MPAQARAVREAVAGPGARQGRLSLVQLPGVEHQRRPGPRQGECLEGTPHDPEGQDPQAPPPEGAPDRAGPQDGGRQLPQPPRKPVGLPGPGGIPQEGQGGAAGITLEAGRQNLLPPVLRRSPEAPFRGPMRHDRLSGEILQLGLPLPQRLPERPAIQFEDPPVGQAVEPDPVARCGDAADQVRMAPGLIHQTEPRGGRPQFPAEFQGKLRGSREAAFEMVQGLRGIERPATELEPVLPVQGEGELRAVQVKFRSERLMNSREKSSSSVWNCLSWPWKKL